MLKEPVSVEPLDSGVAGFVQSPDCEPRPVVLRNWARPRQMVVAAHDDLYRLVAE